MSPEYKKQHYVPQTYLEAWLDLNNKVRVYNKLDDSLYRYGSIKNILYENDFYTRKAEDSLILTDDDINIIFGLLDEYIIEFNGRVLTGIDDYAKNYFAFDEWNIFSKDRKLAKKRKIRNDIEKIRITQIEHNWQFIENDWCELRGKIELCIGKKLGTLVTDDVNHLYNFMIAQRWRTPGAIAFYKDIINILLSSLAESLGEKFEEILYEQTRSYFKKVIMRYQNGDEKVHINTEIETLKNYHIVFYGAKGSEHYLTSDNPVFSVTDDSFINGMYFPVTPKILCAIYKGESNKYSIVSMDENNTKKINELIKKYSTKYYISKYAL